MKRKVANTSLTDSKEASVVSRKRLSEKNKSPEQKPKKVIKKLQKPKQEKSLVSLKEADRLDVQGTSEHFSETHIPEADFFTFHDANIPPIERIISGLSGTILAGYGLKKRSLRGVFLAFAGMGILYRAIRGHSLLYKWLGGSLYKIQPQGESLALEGRVTVNTSAQKVYEFIHDPKNLLELWGIPLHITQRNDTTIQWSIEGPEHELIQFNSETVADVKDRLVSWRSSSGATISHEGSIYLYSKEPNVTEMKVMLKYDPPVSPAILMLFGKDSNELLAEKLLLLAKRIDQKNSKK